MINVIVVGGGTAGWLTALYNKRAFPENKITLIESEDLGILGAGEGTTPHILGLLSFLNIDISNLIKQCGVTVKNGIKFTNWNSNGGYYFHPFLSQSSGSNDYNYYFNDFLESDTAFSHIVSSKFKHSLKDYSFIQKISDKNLTPFYGDLNFLSNNFLNNSISSTSIHFNANILSQYLRKVGEERGVIRKEGLVSNIINNEDGEIKKLILKSGEEIEADFVFDCTGFARLITGNHYKSDWISHSKNLPVNKAIPFFLPIDENIPPYTESIAMDYGWMWKIPLQNRYGCGYVFDSNMISEEKAKLEIDKFMGFEVESPKSFNFNAGFYKNIWIKNSLSIGLSSGFIEPLEATSIWQAIITLQTFLSSYNNFFTKNEKIKERFNKKYYEETKEIVDFLYLHYVTDKTNTDFWKNFTKNNEIPDFISYIIEAANERPLDHRIDFSQRLNMFGVTGYYYVMIGNNILSAESIKKQYKMLKTNKDLEYEEILKNQNSIIPFLINHKDFINSAYV